MQIIRSKDTLTHSNSNLCETTEYSFDDKTMDLGVATITGRYPEYGYCMNMKSIELIYVLEGSGKLFLENDNICFDVGDSILINSNEKYYWDSSYCKVAIISNPAWDYKQYKIIE